MPPDMSLSQRKALLASPRRALYNVSHLESLLLYTLPDRHRDVPCDTYRLSLERSWIEGTSEEFSLGVRMYLERSIFATGDIRSEKHSTRT